MRVIIYLIAFLSRAIEVSSQRLRRQWRFAVLDEPNPERGDVPGWVLVTLMTALLVAGLLAFVGPALMDLLHKAMSDLDSPF